MSAGSSSGDAASAWSGAANVTVQCGRYTVSSAFDSGNAARVERVSDDELIVYTAADCQGQECQTSSRTWFHFCVSGDVVRGSTLRLSVRGLNNQHQLFGQDYRPFVRCVPSAPRWTRLPTAVTVRRSKDDYGISFRYRFEADGDRVYFAFCLGYPYADIVANAQQFCAAMASRPSVFCQSEVLHYSRDGRPMHLITVTSRKGASGGGEREPRLSVPLLPGGEQRPPVFPEKRYMFVSSRVHPGETPASYMLDGFMNFLRREGDPRVQRFLDLFVVKIVPALNPDGVARGHYRADTTGTNLNRVYGDPDPARFPTIWAAEQVVMQLASTGRLFFYLDLHAHANKRGVFVYGNFIKDFERQVDTMMFAKLMTVNSPYFDFNTCVFSEKAMQTKDKRDGASKEGCGRVYFLRSANLTYCYTLESNYHRGRMMNNHPPAVEPAGASGRISPPICKGGACPPFGSEQLEQVGGAVVASVLDLVNENPCSRVPASEFGSLDAVRRSVVASARALHGDNALQALESRLAAAAVSSPPSAVPAGVLVGGSGASSASLGSARVPASAPAPLEPSGLVQAAAASSSSSSSLGAPGAGGASVPPRPGARKPARTPSALSSSSSPNAPANKGGSVGRRLSVLSQGGVPLQRRRASSRSSSGSGSRASSASGRISSARTGSGASS